MRPSKYYHSQGIDKREYSSLAYERKRKLELFNKMVLEGTSKGTALEALQISQATLYRWRRRYGSLGLTGLEAESRRPFNLRQPIKNPKLEQLVYFLRKENPLWGRNKIATLINRDYRIKASIPTVGRIISSFIKRGKLKPAWYFYGPKPRKPREFKGHAKRWKYGMKASRPGELIQIDHMDVDLPDAWHPIKHFNAVCPITKWNINQVFSKATANNATQFLDQVIKNFPFPVRSIQVDGGCEFMSEFEIACAARDIALWVLPPRSPEYNGSVERTNGTLRREFYQCYAGDTMLFDLQKALDRWTHRYNHFRPHQALGNLTPFLYYQAIRNKEAHLSQMY